MAHHIEGVIVCVNYADFLAWTLPANRNQFNRLVVVTTPEDRDTQALCERYEVECVRTDAFTRDGDVFAKAKGINEGLARLSRRGWVVHLDADIYMPPKTRRVLDNLPLDERKIYGADRLMCPSAHAFARYLDLPPPVQSDWVFVHATAFPLGVRLAQYMEYRGGYVPIGYWQMWHPGGSGVHRYPDTHGTAARTDFQHGTSWPRERRELLPEIVVVHLESAPGMALNWEGRTTPPFRLGADDAPASVPPHPALPRYAPPWYVTALRGVVALLRRVWRWVRGVVR